jgi:hypothetical protein
MKQHKYPVLVRFANESIYYTTIDLHPDMLTDILKFDRDVFVTVDGTRISIKREDYDAMIKFYEDDV